MKSDLSEHDSVKNISQLIQAQKVMVQFWCAKTFDNYWYSFTYKKANLHMTMGVFFQHYEINYVKS